MAFRKLFQVCCLLIFAIEGCKRKSGSRLVLDFYEPLPDFPSASATAYDGKKIYIAGDDAHSVLVLNDSLQEIDRIRLFDSTSPRLPKEHKADLESAAFMPKGDSILLLLGSGSLDPYRNVAWKVNTLTREKQEIRLDTFFQLLHGTPIKETNIEGIAPLQNGILLVNRGNKTYPKNYLVFTTSDFWQHQARTPLRFVKVGFNQSDSSFNGVSGLDYSFKSDRLFLSVSTENTFNSMEDGAIGKSYLWVINNLSSKKKFITALNPDEIYDLDEAGEALKSNKIESVSILSETNDKVTLLMVADNDDGSSKAYRLILFK